MNLTKRPLALLLSVLWSSAHAELKFGGPSDTPEFLPPGQAYQVSAQALDGQWQLNLNITDGYYLYADKLAPYSVTYGLKQPLTTEPGLRKDYPDPLFGTVKIFEASQSLQLTQSPTNGELWVELQGCSKKGLCYPPEQRLLTIIQD